MNTLLWTLQGLLAFVFLYSGINKTWLDEKTLVAKGQTGVEGLSPWLIKFIGISEILGAAGLILPLLFDNYIFLTPLAAACLGFIMLPAAFIHYKRGEIKNFGINVIILIICGFIAWLRYN